ncbi:MULTISPECIES: hypothetical protein [Amycolatopsis]|uniref:Hpt domain-containing protein n=2 Tax=Amycolatopsis TaxID=1813 RepID=A0ABQ3JDL8_9PSEU|nr:MULTISPECIES: hypothetical protein [Amycolatopsis]MCF6423209.1 hypothetical protein [Amycolatopsis tucumanensis]GHF13765.1 hypothetical protein GCM10017786_54300 [Amycolatopsis deserti]
MSLVPESTILPLTVAAAHLEACAAELDRAPETDLGEIVAVLKHLVAGQRHLSGALTGLAERLGEARFGALAAMPSAEMAALVEILQAAGAAFGYSADALGESEPLAAFIAANAGESTRL